MTVMSDLPLDLVEEILSRVPITSLRALRSTCKRWNDSSKDPRLTKKYYGKEANETMAVMICHSKACLMSVNLQDHKDLVDSSIKQIGKLNQVKISSVYHCDGLLLCLTDEKVLRLMVWNPNLGQIRWIQCPRNELGFMIDTYAIGYDSNNNHKILKLHSWPNGEIYDFKSSSWRFLGVTTDRYKYRRGIVNLKGNTYLIARRSLEETEEFLVCFDFTSETFGPRLPLPFHSIPKDAYVQISVVREEKLAVFFKKWKKYEFGIWITTKIEHNIVSWRNFLKVDMITPLTEKYRFPYGSFFVDEKKKVAMIFDLDRSASNYKAYMVGENGYYKEVDLRENKSWILMCSYVPSSVQISSKVPSTLQEAKDKKKEMIY